MVGPEPRKRNWSCMAGIPATAPSATSGASNRVEGCTGAFQPDIALLALSIWSAPPDVGRSPPVLLPMRAAQVLGVLHLDQARLRARELGAQALAGVQLRDRRGGRQHEVHAMVVEFVDEVDETPRRIFHLWRKARHAGNQH